MLSLYNHIFGRTQIGLILWPLALCWSSCASTEPKPYRIAFDQNVSILTENGQTKDVKRGASISHSRRPLTVAGPDLATVVLIPIPAAPGLVRVRLPQGNPLKVGPVKQDQASLADCKEAKASSVDINAVARSIIQVQSLLVEKRPDEALARIQALRERYPSFSYLRFLEASCFVLKNDLPKARDLVSLALKDFPDDAVARQFMADLNAIGVQGSTTDTNRTDP